MILQNVSDVPVAKPLVELLADIQNTTWSAFHLENNASRLEIVSRLYLCVASWFWSLYVPDIPLDPILASQAVDSLNWTEWEETIGEAAVEGCAFDEAGGKGMCRLDYLADRLLALHANVQEGQISQPRAEAQYQEILVSLFTELRSCTNILSTSEIMQGILAGDTEATLSQLENLQASLASIHQRLEVFYATYSDIVQPIMVALGTAIVGLGVRKHFAAVKTRGSLSTSLSKAVKTLVSKPSAVLLDSLAAIDLHTSATTGEAAAVPPATELLLRLHALAAHRKITIHFPDPKQLSTICSAYEQVFALWTIDHKRAEQAREQAESIYRSRRDDFKAAEDAAREEEELLALFPTFQGLEELDGNMERTSGASTNRKTLLQYEDVDYIFRAHLLLFGHSSDQDEEEVRCPRRNTC